MSDNRLPSNTFNDGLAIELPEFMSMPAIRLDLSNIVEADRRETKLMVKNVNPSTYSHLEYVYNEAYRDLKKHVATVGYQILRADSELEKAKATALLEKFPVFLDGKPKNMNNAAVRDAFVAQDESVRAIKDRLDSLKMIEIFLDGRIKVMENVCRFMRKQMDMYIRAGAGLSPDIFNSQK
jgi:hypothetical protein